MGETTVSFKQKQQCRGTRHITAHCEDEVEGAGRVFPQQRHRLRAALRDGNCDTAAQASERAAQIARAEGRHTQRWPRHQACSTARQHLQRLYSILHSCKQG